MKVNRLKELFKGKRHLGKYRVAITVRNYGNSKVFSNGLEARKYNLMMKVGLRLQLLTIRRLQISPQCARIC